MQIRLYGKPFNIVIDFPWEKAVFISLKIEDSQGREVQRLEKPISKETFDTYSWAIPLAKSYLSKFF